MLNFAPTVKPVELEGQTVHVREMCGVDFGQFLEAAKGEGYSAVLALLLYTLCDAGGRLLYSALEDVAKLPRRIIDQLADHASKVNGLGDKPDDTKSPAQ